MWLIFGFDAFRLGFYTCFFGWKGLAFRRKSVVKTWCFVVLCVANVVQMVALDASDDSSGAVGDCHGMIFCAANVHFSAGNPVYTET